MFKDRLEAGRQLAQKLSAYAGRDSVVLALPRGGVVTGHAVAQALKIPLDIVVTRKIGHPGDPEYAMCAINEEGVLFCNEAERASVDPAWLKEESIREQKEARRRSTAYREGRAPVPLAGKTAIIVDDGVATGLSMRLAVATAKAQNPKRVVVAVPVAPPDSVRELGRVADEVVVLEPPEKFLGAVGAHYEQFEQVEDAEVIRLMRR